jgi:hypothetical protein
MAQGLLHLRFDDIMTAVGANIRGITLLRHPGALPLVETAVLSNSSRAVGQNSTLLRVALSQRDMNGLRRVGIGLREETTWLTLDADVFVDSSGVGNRGTPAPLKATAVIRDQGPPALVSFVLDLNQGALLLSFDEVMNASSLRAGQLNLRAGGPLASDATQLALISSYVCRACVAEERMVSPCSSEQQCQCVPCLGCDADHFQVSACTSEAERTCRLCSTCGDGQYEVAACSAFEDTLCANCSGACPSNTFLAAPCQAEADRACQACSVCPLGSFTLHECNATHDTECRVCRSCDGSNSFVQTECMLDTDRTCGTCAQCSEDTFVARNCSHQDDTLCLPCRSCAEGQYEASACEGGADRDCRECTSCAAGFFAAQRCSATVDTGCEACTECGPGFYTSVACNATHDAQCRPCAAGCEACSDSTRCLSCNESTALWNGTCSSLCPAGQFPEAGRCVPCHSNCLSCVGAGEHSCTACRGLSPLSDLAGGTCLQLCQPGHYNRSVGGGEFSCAPCHGNCSECYGPDAHQCLACPPALQFLSDGFCLSACPSGTWAAETTCTPCGLGCLVCDSERCLECEGGLLLSDGGCSPSCPVDAYQAGP